MKVKVSKSQNKRTKLDFSHDVHTTGDIGFVQPICRLELIPGSTLHINDIASRMRLMPLVAPTYGQYHLKHYAQFVPMRDIYMPYDNFITGTGYNGVSGNYIPESVPYITLSTLTQIVCCYSGFQAFKLQGGKWIVDSDSTRRNDPHWENVFPQAFRMIGQRPIDMHQDILSHEMCDFFIEDVAGKAYGFKLNKYGKNLRKIFIGLGYQLNYDSYQSVSFLPILAYYKAYWEIFAPKQTENWYYTYAYSLINLIAQYDFSNIFGAASGNQEFNDAFFHFIDNLAHDCFYVCNPDYFTMQLDTMAKSMSSVNFNTYDASGGMVEVSQSDYDNVNQATTDLTDTPSGVQISVLQKLTRWINRNSVIGQRVSALMNAMGLGSADDNKKSYFIGSQTSSVDIYPVMSTADTFDGAMGSSLGDFTGQGVADGHSGSMKFDVDCAGYVIILSTVVPRMNGNQYFQGVQGDLFHLGRMEFYQPDFDAMTYVPSHKSQYMGAEELGSYLKKNDHSGSFGFQPVYSEYKYKNDVVNGDMSLRSTRTELMPYNLDRFITPSEITENGSFSQQFNPQVSPELRYIGKHEYFGNFNRPFQHSSDDKYWSLTEQPLEDNFIITNYLDIDVVAPVKPLSESFDTFVDGDGGFSIEKA